MDTEVELKLTVSPQAVGKLKKHPIIAENIANIQTHHLRNWYYDTSSFSLSEHRLAIRIRESGSRFIQTVKTAGSSSGGLHERQEFEADVKYPELEIDKVSSSEIRGLLSALSSELRVVFTTDFTRETLDIPFQSSLIEMAIDQGQVEAKKRSWPISEIELELKRGDPQDIFALAKELAGKVPLQIHEITKAGRGYQLARGTEAPIAVSLPQGDTLVLDAFRAIISNQLSQLLACVANWQEAQSQTTFVELIRSFVTIKDLLWMFKSAVSRSASTEIRSQLMDVYEQLEPLDEQCRYGLWLSELEKLRLGDLDSQQTLLAWAKSYKHIKSWDTLIPEINDIVFGVQMGQMLISLSEWVYLQPWRGDESSRLKKRSKRSLAAFLAHWFEEHWLDVEQNVRDIKQDEGGWQGPQQRIERLIRLTLYWQQFYKEKKVRRFLAPWHDLVAGADELNRLKWLAHKVDKLPQNEQGEVLDWLGNERGACVMAITQTLEGLNRLKPFWG